MREIIFRGKRVDTVGNGEWIEGYYAAEPYVENTYNRGYILENEKDLFAKKAWLVDSRTVGQFIGLTDKNGKKIFEGDILKICYDSPLFDGYDTECICYNGIVKYENALFVCEDNSERGDALCTLSSNEFEIIGNIHDNPELLEVAK